MLQQRVSSRVRKRRCQCCNLPWRPLLVGRIVNTTRHAGLHICRHTFVLLARAIDVLLLLTLLCDHLERFVLRATVGGCIVSSSPWRFDRVTSDCSTAWLPTRRCCPMALFRQSLRSRSHRHQTRKINMSQRRRSHRIQAHHRQQPQHLR
jgi:hypothetical protein